MKRLVPTTLCVAMLAVLAPVATGCSRPPTAADGNQRDDLPDDETSDRPLDEKEPVVAKKPPPPTKPPDGNEPRAPVSLPLQTGEPSYCEPATFAQKEIALDPTGIANMHAFKLGSVTLAGLGVGDSDTAYVAALAKKQAPSLTAAEKSCTFYYNDGNEAAQTAFNWYYVSKPTGTKYAAKVAEYSEVLRDVFDTKPTSFLSCAATHKYVAMGCDGMHHRGPSVFAAALAYSGCTPEHATEIVNLVWGEHGIDPRMRIEIAKWAADLGAQHPVQSSQLRQLLGGEPN